MQLRVEREILGSKDFQQLVTVRRWVSWSFLLVLLGLYLAFGLLSAYAPAVLAQPMFSSAVVPFGIVMGYGILLLTFTLTVVYVWIANNYFVPLERKIMASITSGTSQ